MFIFMSSTNTLEKIGSPKAAFLYKSDLGEGFLVETCSPYNYFDLM